MWISALELVYFYPGFCGKLQLFCHQLIEKVLACTSIDVFRVAVALMVTDAPFFEPIDMELVIIVLQ